MTITVTAPNGSTVQFPDGTDHDTINGVMTQNFHPDANAAPPPDKYQQAAADEAASLDKSGAPRETGLTRRLVHGATLGADSTIMAGLETPLEMIKRGTFSPAEGYNYAKAREDQEMGDARKNTGLAGDAAEMLGGAVTGGALARNGITAASALAPDAGLIARTGASAADAAGLGAVSGFNEGNGVKERFNNALKGAGTGALAGAALPLAGALASTVAAPIVSNIRARINPEGFANAQIARAVSESGQTPQQLGATVAGANADGVPLTLADALGPAGQKMLAAANRGPGEANTQITNFLEGRQAGQGRRIANTLAQGFDAPQTAAQTEAALTRARGTQADADYGAVRNDAEPVDVTNVLDHIDQQLAPFGVPHDRLAMDELPARLAAYRRMLGGTDNNLDGSAAGGLNDFNAAQMVRSQLSDEVNTAMRAGQGNKARLLGGVLTRLDSSLENASPGFRQANANFRSGSRNIEAVQTGRDAAMRGRTEDTIPAFQSLTAPEQSAFRAGYVDPLISSTQAAAHGANKARPLTSDAFRDEAAAVAPNNTQMQRNLGLENTMFETRARALGGSKTAENIADDAAMGVDPHVVGTVGHILHGNVGGAVAGVAKLVANGMTGNTPAVRAAVGRALLDRGVSPANLQAAIGQTVARIQFIQNLTRNVGRGAAGALAVERPGQQVGAPYRGANLGPLQ